jgi:hypothetical protein
LHCITNNSVEPNLIHVSPSVGLLRHAVEWHCKSDPSIEGNSARDYYDVSSVRRVRDGANYFWWVRGIGANCWKPQVHSLALWTEALN